MVYLMSIHTVDYSIWMIVSLCSVGSPYIDNSGSVHRCSSAVVIHMQ